MRNSEFKLHLGCGSNYLPGYINIDQIDDQNVLAAPRKVDINANILKLNFKKGSIDEIRLHHVFEHFHRYQVVALMVVWNNWLKPKGRLVIETPNFSGAALDYLLCRLARKYIDTSQIRGRQYQSLRHLYGSKEADWANHFEGWDSTTLKDVYDTFGFTIEKIVESRGPLAITLIQGQKARQFTHSQASKGFNKFLKWYVVNHFELKIWMKQAQDLYSQIIRRPLINLSKIKL